MADVRAFRGLRYNLRQSQDLGSLVAPPYDVISPEAQRALYARSDHNIIRLELGLDQEGDSAEHNKYTRAAALFAEWQRQGVLLAEPQPGMYIYEHEFAHRGQRKVRRGLIAGLRLETWDSGIVLPHEETLAKPLADRLRLMLACHANFSPVFGLFEDETGSVASLLEAQTAIAPTVSCRSDDGDEHRLWVVAEADLLRDLRRLLAPARVFIADGHHRYQTALRYRDRMRDALSIASGSAASGPDARDRAFNFVMTLLVDLNDPGLVVLPTHRLVHLPSLDLEALAVSLERYFTIEHVPIQTIGLHADRAVQVLQSLMATGAQTVFGVYGLRPGAFSKLILRPDADVDSILPHEHSQPWRRLDVSILHVLVIERILGLSNMSAAEGSQISFIRDERQAFAAVEDGNFQLAFFLNPPSVVQMRAVALAGDKMPQKSTCFHPKPLTGLVLNRLDGALDGAMTGEPV